MTPALIVLLTDFGQSDWYVAEMKGVLLSAAPAATLVDFTHEVPPGDVARAAFLLGRGHQSYPEGAVFVVVVDPGVGTARHPLAVHAGARFYVGPDNGVLEAALKTPAAEARVIEDQPLLETASATFHGRDLFAPIAARLAVQGSSAFRKLGRVLERPVRLEEPGEARAPGALTHASGSGGLVTRVAHVDRFGNAITGLRGIELETWLGGRDPAGAVFTARGALGERVTEVRGLAVTYGPGRGEEARPIALVGSSGLIELALPGAHAALRLGLAPGDPIELHYEKPPGR